MPSPARSFASKHAFLSGLHLHEEHHSSDRKADTHKHDAERTKSPSVVQVVVKQLRNARPAKCAGNHWRIVDTEYDHAIPQGGHVGDHHIDHVLLCSVSIDIQDISSIRRRHIRSTRYVQSNTVCERRSTSQRPCRPLSRSDSARR